MPVDAGIIAASPIISLCMFIVKCVKFSLLSLLRDHHPLLHIKANSSMSVDCSYIVPKQGILDRNI
jgi:hypothetical protein